MDDEGTQKTLYGGHLLPWTLEVSMFLGGVPLWFIMNRCLQHTSTSLEGQLCPFKSVFRVVS